MKPSALSIEILKILNVKGQIRIEELRSELKKTVVFLDFDFENTLIRFIRMRVVRVVVDSAKFRTAEKYKGNIIRNSGIVFEYVEKI